MQAAIGHLLHTQLARFMAITLGLGATNNLWLQLDGLHGTQLLLANAVQNIPLGLLAYRLHRRYTFPDRKGYVWRWLTLLLLNFAGMEALLPHLDKYGWPTFATATAASAVPFAVKFILCRLWAFRARLPKAITA